MGFTEAADGEAVLKNLRNSQESTCVGVSFSVNMLDLGLHICQKEALTQAFPYEFCEICLNTFY